jgi:lysophospholipase L1-like esterase
LTILVLLLALAAIAWKAWSYRKSALAALAKVEVISERFTKSDFFEAENRAWLERGERPDVVFLGASITRRWNPVGKLGDLKVAQRGVGGQWPSHYLLRFASDVLDLRPRAVVIKACAISFRPGVNEKGTRRALLDMLAQAEAAGIKPVLATCVPVREDGNVVYGSDGRKQPGGINDRLLPYNDWLRQLAAARGYGLIDFYKAMADEKGFLPADLAEDDIHPNDKGYAVMTATAKPVLDALLAAGGD